LARFRLNLAGIVGKYVGIPYKLGGNDLSGMDCLMLVNSIGRELGADIPDKFRGITEEDYTKLWTDFPEQAKLTLLSYVLSLGEKVEVPFMFPPDLVLFKDGEGILGVGLYVGKGMILASFVEDRIDLVHRESYPIEVVIRWVIGRQGR
jgi:cell wall-associated NlpC family hydrolase